MQRQNRFLLFLALTFLVWSLYLRMVTPPPPLSEPAPAAADTDRVARPAPEPSAPLGAAKPLDRPPVSEPIAEPAEKIVEVSTPLYQARLSNRGGGEIVSFTLTEHQDSRGWALEMVPREASEKLDRRPLAIEAGGGEATQALRQALFQASASELQLKVGEEASVEFRWADGRGLEALRTLVLSADSYRIEASASVRFEGAELPKRVLFGPGLEEESIESTYIQKERGVIQGGGELRVVDASDLESPTSASVDVQAVGVTSHYFAGLLLAPKGSGYGAALSRETLEVGEARKKRDFITAGLIVPGEPARFSLFVGPKDRELMAKVGPGLQEIVDAEFGSGFWTWFRYVVLALRSGLLWIHERVGNYGWAVVLLTIAINVALSPLKHYSYVSMRKMQKLAPQIKRIQERYKKLKPTDPRRRDMNTEVLALYREHKVSPFSGCLPILLMIPFFFAFYRLMLVSIELRHAPFLWVRDLSTHDPYFLLPLLMGASQIAIQMMTPQTTADPLQAKMMKFMPVIFVVLLAWAPSGLVLYWFVNNLVSLAQQAVTNKLVPAT
jgi:YidC/Oxa1 family membrane protein insertase